jgi:hypothetical protein
VSEFRLIASSVPFSHVFVFVVSFAGDQRHQVCAPFYYRNRALEPRVNLFAYFIRI